jgi:hypothetical protein
MVAKFPTTAAQPEPTALSFTPSPEARAHAHSKGGDIAGLLAQLHQRLGELRQVVATLVWLTPSGDENRLALNTLLRKLYLITGEVELFGAAGSHTLHDGDR